MRRSRRGGHGILEFGGSGEDSFVAVVVTKLTGALLFILLLTMVIMALLPKAATLSTPEAQAAPSEAEEPRPELTITTPESLPEAIAGRSYTLALAASGGQGPLQWSLDGKLPNGLTFDTDSGLIEGTPQAGTPEPVELVVRVSDGADRASQTTHLVVYQSDQPLSTPVWWKPRHPPIPWCAWLEQGFGFLVLWLVYLVGSHAVRSLERWSRARIDADHPAAADDEIALRRRFFTYRWLVRLASLSAAGALAVWLWGQSI